MNMNRFLRVSYALPYSDSHGRLVQVPSIRLQGKWVEKLGFTVGSRVMISCKQGEIKLRLLEEEPSYGKSQSVH